MSILEKLFGLYVTDIRYSVQNQGVPNSVAERKLRIQIRKKLDQHTREQFDNLLIDIMSDYEQQGFMNGFRFATSIWKEC